MYNCIELLPRWCRLWIPSPLLLASPPTAWGETFKNALHNYNDTVGLHNLGNQFLFRSLHTDEGAGVATLEGLAALEEDTFITLSALNTKNNNTSGCFLVFFFCSLENMSVLSSHLAEEGLAWHPDFGSETLVENPLRQMFYERIASQSIFNQESVPTGTSRPRFRFF